MECKCWMNIVFATSLIYLYGSTAKKCVDTTRPGTKNWHCCDNHEEVNGTCVACSIGYLSNFGEHCTECQKGLYGLKCTKICNCRDTESCHHVEGCIDKTESKKELTTESDKLVQVTYPAIRPSLVSVSSTKEDSFLGLSQREIIVYSTGIGGFTFLFLLLLCIGRHKLKNRLQSVVSENNITRNNAPMSVVTTDSPAGIYETIDESNMIDAPLQVSVPMTLETTSSEESTNSEHSHSLPHEYLNPYQHMVQDPQKHVYNFATNICSDDSVSSGSSGTNSAYLNPYQQIVPDSEPHNYLSIQAECHCLASSISEENEEKEEYGKKKTIQLEMEYEVETKDKDGNELQNLHLHEMKNTNLNKEIHVEDIIDCLPVDVLSGCDMLSHEIH